MNKPLKIIYVCNWYNTIYNDLFNRISQRNKIVMIISDRYSNYKNNKYDVKIFKTMGFKFFIRNLFNIYFIYKSEFKKYIDVEKPDLLVSNLYYLPSTHQSYRISKKNKIPFILQTELKRYSNNFLKKQIQKMLLFCSRPMLKYSSLILPWTEEGVRSWKTKFPKYKDKIKLMPAGVDIKNFRKTKNKLKNEFRILCVARFVSYKNHKDLIQSFVELNKENKLNDMKLYLLGNGPLKESIIKHVKKNNLDDKIKFLDKVPHERMNNLYSEHDFLILPSYNEAIGMCVPEAMACGTPCIVSDTSGAKMYVKDKENGYIFKTGDVKDLKSKILLLKDKNKIEFFGKKSEKYIKENYDVDVVANKFEKMIEDLKK